jgi:polysaccharide biosynthesis/export protein
MEGVCSEPLWPWLLEEYPDYVCDGDILEIALYHPSRIDLIRAVGAIGDSVGYEVVDGYIRLPDAPPILVGGLSLEEARKRIEGEYLKQIQDVEIFIRYRDRRVRKVELIGMVRLPVIPADGKLRLYEALAIAQVPDSANFFKSYLVRDGRPLPVDMNKLIRYGDMSQNVVLRGGDKIYIASPAESRVMVMGEVGMPQAIPLPQGYMSLREALVLAGGIPFTGNKSCIQVIRGNILCPKIYSLNWHCIIHLPNDSLLLMPGDTVYVAAKPITDWNRFISQLLPSFVGAQTVYSTSTMVGGVFVP